MTSTPTSSPTSSPATRTQAAASVDIQLDPSERSAFVGKTGSGKSFLARFGLGVVARRGWRVVIVDPQGMWMGKRPRYPRSGPGTVDAPRLVTAFDKRLAAQIYVPTTPAYADTGLEALCEDVLKTGDTVVYFDELYGVADQNRMSPGFLKLWTQGRKLNVGAWSAMQRPARVPEYVLSQAENWFVFRLVTPIDRKKVAEYTGTPQIAGVNIPSRWWWYLHMETMDQARLMQPLQVGKGASARAALTAGGKGSGSGKGAA